MATLPNKTQPVLSDYEAFRSKQFKARPTTSASQTNCKSQKWSIFFLILYCSALTPWTNRVLISTLASRSHQAAILVSRPLKGTFRRGHNLFHLFIDSSELVGVAGLLVGVVGLCFSLFCLVADQSLRSSCLPMTNLAQLHDCHSCYDERSIDQKKNP